MNNAALYSQYNNLQKTDANYIIENYTRLINWKNKDNILDIGSGDGSVTLDLLLPKIPKNFNKLIGVDVSKEMVNFAKTQSRNPRIDFCQMDISSKDIPLNFQENFHHIFSFYCLHWVENQRLALRNMYKMLRPGGDILLLFLANTPMYDIFESMAKSPKWGKYMQDYKKFVSPYYYYKNPVKEMEGFLKKEGFTTYLCRNETRYYTFENFSVLSNAVLAVNPFLKKIPKDEVDDYISDYIQEVKKIERVKIEKCNNNNEDRIQVPNIIFIVFASKPY